MDRQAYRGSAPQRRMMRQAWYALAMMALVTISVIVFLGQVLPRLADATFSAANNGNQPGVSRPVSPFRSGSPSSLVTWNSLGMQGRAFVSGGYSRVCFLTAGHAL